MYKYFVKNEKLKFRTVEYLKYKLFFIQNFPDLSLVWPHPIPQAREGVWQPSLQQLVAQGFHLLVTLRVHNYLEKTDEAAACGFTVDLHLVISY